ncbi:MAG: HNH endonuclease [Gammaproteobacteria bacterium]|nr:HNH endonuclease [Gammaproteobacteria bacterium]MCW8924089.1 HNH endonuclease [Gammaproteobacteria bacterium]
MNKRYTTEQLHFLRDGFKAMRLPELTAAFNKAFSLNKTEGQIRSTLKNHKFRCGERPASTKIVSHIFSDEQVEFIQEQYKQHDINELTAIINEKFGMERTVAQMRAFMKNHKITCGRTGQFEKGNIPWTAGTAGTGVCKPNSGCFKKGDVPANRNELGAERICSKDGYVLVKINEPNPYTGAPTRYRAKQLVIWEQHNGPIPKGMIVTFIDGDKLNCDIDNLELITKAENLQRNRIGINKFPDELRPNIRALAKLETVRFKLINEKRS